jgi:membrane fusion protein (multidrug efflux system)
MMQHKHLSSIALVAAVVVVGGALAIWKNSSLAEAASAAANQAEPIESVAVAVAQQANHFRATTAIGTVVATRSISVRNELPGTVRRVALQPGRIVEPGEVLVALDISVEEADLRALEAQAKLAETQYERMQRMNRERAASDMEVDTARAERDVAVAQIERIKAVIDRKTIRAPFRARVGISDVHPGQYLNEGTLLTTLQGVDESAYVDFSVAQQVAARLRDGDEVQIHTEAAAPVAAKIVAVDARVDPATRNATVRAQVRDREFFVRPGASVRVQVPTEEPRLAVTIPASAVRKSPSGDAVFVIETADDGQTRARVRPVKVEAAQGDNAVIAEGLAAGEQVAAAGSFKLRDAVLVAITNPQEVVARNAPASTTDRG